MIQTMIVVKCYEHSLSNYKPVSTQKFLLMQGELQQNIYAAEHDRIKSHSWNPFDIDRTMNPGVLNRTTTLWIVYDIVRSFEWAARNASRLPGVSILEQPGTNLGPFEFSEPANASRCACRWFVLPE